MKTAEKVAEELANEYRGVLSSEERLIVLEGMAAKALTAFREEGVKEAREAFLKQENLLGTTYREGYANGRAEALSEAVHVIQDITNFGNHMVLNEAIEAIQALKEKP